MIRITHPQDFWSGILFMAFGAAGAYLGSDLALGALTKMGPGFLPKALSWLLIALGAFITLRSFALRGDPIQRSTWRPQFFIIAAIGLFAFAIQRVGLVPTVFLVVLVASFAATEVRLRDSLLLGAGMSLACYLIFVRLLGLPLLPIAWNF
jgi:putative tricarboxylic transport membrane protein